MSNASPDIQPNITISLLECPDTKDAYDPNECPLIEEWVDRPVTAIIWDPVEQFFLSKEFPILTAGRSYWIKASSSAAAGFNPLWAMTMATEYTCLKQPTEDGELVWMFPGVTQASAAKVTGNLLE
jgi:hypothetical protein